MGLIYVGGVLEQPVSYGLPAGQLVNLRQVGEGQGFCPGAVQLGIWSLTSCSTLCSSSLCIRDLLKFQVCVCVGGSV